MGETAARRQQIARAAAVMHEWKGTDAHALHTLTVRQLYDTQLALLLEAPIEHVSWHQGYLKALKDVLDIPDRSIREHQRQVEAA